VVRGPLSWVAAGLVVGLLAACGGPAEPAPAGHRTVVATTAPGGAPAPAPATTPPTADTGPEPTTAPASPAPASPTPADVLRPNDSGPEVLALQQRLSDLGYWLGAPDGQNGLLTQQAVLALQGAAGLGRDGVVGPQTRRALQAGTVPEPRSGSGHVIEIDLGAGLLMFVDDGRPTRVLHTSTGTFKPYVSNGRQHVADTPKGRWQVTWSYDGWRQSELGRLYRPRYFHPDGIAVHGFTSVPAYPASHGCARVTMEAMDMIWRDNLMPSGATVLVY
jgi:peptidoglycan hydrolase-like protein with peptidoglycan-binding domain